MTFNQDLVVEKAIHNALKTQAYSHIPFTVATAYYVDFDDYVRPGGSAGFKENYTGRPSYAVLKLHGSLNWVYPVRSADDAKNALRVPSSRLFCIDDPTIRLRIRLESGTRAQDTLPLVVPPIYEKSGVIREKLRPVWSAAREAIQRADRIVVFGYSFPEADVAARNMLRSAFHANQKVEHVSIVDASPEVASQIGSWVGCPSFSFYRSVRVLQNSWLAT